MLKNINWAPVWHYKLGLLITWASKNQDIGSLSRGQYNSMFWAHDESQDAFDEFSKTGTRKFLLGNVSKSNFWQMYEHMKVCRWIRHDLRKGVLQEFLGYNTMIQSI